ncbi:MAG: hypothetical protein KDD09_02260, partial [Phaeodactylibacter sp.]|nr:hypothetical protein [Phaeodactylibacter sp.]
GREPSPWLKKKSLAYRNTTLINRASLNSSVKLAFPSGKKQKKCQIGIINIYSGRLASKKLPVPFGRGYE